MALGRAHTQSISRPLTFSIPTGSEMETLMAPMPGRRATNYNSSNISSDLPFGRTLDVIQGRPEASDNQQTLADIQAMSEKAGQG